MINDQIKPILHYSLTLTFQQDVYTFIKQRRSTVRVVNIRDPLQNIPQLEKIKSQSQVLKLTIHLKLVKTLRLKDSVPLTDLNRRPLQALRLMKKMRKVQTLCLKEILSEKIPLCLYMWLRNTKRITKVDYHPMLPQNQKDVETYHRISKLFRFMNRLKIKGFSIAAATPYENKLASIFHFPSSIQYLALSCIESILLQEESPICTNSFENLTNLKSLHIKFSHTSSILVSLINSIQDLSQLQTLELSVRNSQKDAIDCLVPFLNALKKSNNLKRLRLSFPLFPDNLDKLFEAVNCSSLTEFSFSSHPKNAKQWIQLCIFLSSLEKIEFLKLVVPYLRPKSPMLDIELSPIDFMSTLNELSKKSVRLHTFDLVSTNSDETYNSMVEIMNMLAETAPYLKKLKIYSKEIPLSDDQFNKFLEFLYSLKEIESLELPSIKILGQERFKQIVNWCCCSNNLKILRLDSVEYIVSIPEFVKLVESVLLKKGLERFICSLKNVRVIKSWPKTDLKWIKQMNPCLQYYPEFILNPPMHRPFYK